ncbi:hypothetical protein DRP04_08655 [Archaeoglobales archaeon]|nr:MAG: hypothetical protein DRP04_08655 [Archaeoglobales archaeon]
MKTYDEVEGFIDYTSKEEWKTYITNSVIPLWRTTWILKEYFEELKGEFDNLLLSEVKEEDRPLLLGGIRPSSDEIFSPNSLAKFYLRFFGLRLKDMQSWILQQQHGETLTEIIVEVAETEFIKLVREIFTLLDYALQYQTLVSDFEEPQLNYEELKRDPEKVKELIKEFYQALLNITLNHNYGTFFLCSINQVSYKTLKAAYPRIDQALEFLQTEFGLTELDWNNPINPETQAFKDYTIYCFPEYNPRKVGKSFGGAIVKLNELLWSKFSYSSEIRETLSMLFGKIPDLKEEFRERVKPQLPEKYYSWIYFKGITASESTSRIEESGKTLMEMLDGNMPWLFTSLIKIDYVSDNSFSFISFG